MTTRRICIAVTADSDTDTNTISSLLHMGLQEAGFRNVTHEGGEALGAREIDRRLTYLLSPKADIDLVIIETTPEHLQVPGAVWDQEIRHLKAEVRALRDVLVNGSEAFRRQLGEALGIPEAEWAVADVAHLISRVRQPR